MTLFEVAQELVPAADRHVPRDGDGRRPVYGGPSCSKRTRTGAT